MRAKICGITRLEDALFAVKNGAWAIGFNFYKKSPRYISLKVAKMISAALPTTVKKVGIWVEATPQEIQKSFTFLDLAQVYKDLVLPSSDKNRMIFVSQANKIEALPKPSILQDYACLLLDAPKDENQLLGGTGRLANWELAKTLARRYKLILAGGLNPNNVLEAIKCVQPFAVDVASGVEASSGVKDLNKVKEFLLRCHDVY